MSLFSSLTRRWHWLLAASTLLVLLIIIYPQSLQYLFTDSQASTHPPTFRTKVALAAVEQRNMAPTITGIGELEANQQIQLATEVAGRVQQVDFNSGQLVKAGQVLVQLNDAPEQAERLILQARLENAERQYARKHRLAAQDAVTKEQLENALAERDMALGALAEVKARIAQKTIRAPFSGRLGIRQIHTGEYLSAGQTIASLVDTSRLQVNFSLDAQKITALTIGQDIQLLIDAYPDQPFSAQISAIDPLISAARTVQVQATLQATETPLQAGMHANILVTPSLPMLALSIPETAITYTTYGETVFITEADAEQGLRVKRIAVRSGVRQDGYVAIEHGLTANDQVVVSGQLKLSDGMPVAALAEDTLAIPVNPTPETAL